MEKDQEQLVQQAETLLDRLERLSADSIWAHKASGLRGALIRSLAQLSNGDVEVDHISDLVGQGFHILNQAAREIPDHYDQSHTQDRNSRNS
jgi:hypothetical protein